MRSIRNKYIRFLGIILVFIRAFDLIIAVIILATFPFENRQKVTAVPREEQTVKFKVRLLSVCTSSTDQKFVQTFGLYCIKGSILNMGSELKVSDLSSERHKSNTVCVYLQNNLAQTEHETGMVSCHNWK